jgi:hypothetical protein
MGCGENGSLNSSCASDFIEVCNHCTGVRETYFYFVEYLMILLSFSETVSLHDKYYDVHEIKTTICIIIRYTVMDPYGVCIRKVPGMKLG